MKINLFFNHNKDIRWSYYTIANAGLGGNYVALWNVAREMAQNDHDVTIFGYINREDVYERVKMRDISTLVKDPSLGECDVFISCESGRAPNYFVAKKSVNWIHRNVVNDTNDSSGFDATVVASRFHKDYLGLHDALIIPNGVDTDLFRPTDDRPRENGSMFFAGHPIKGMSELITIKSKLREVVGAQHVMHVFGNAEIWGWDQSQFADLQTKMIKQRIKYHGRVGQKQLARFIRHYQLLIYPTNFQEPFGMAVLEAMACGVVPIVSTIGNLPELVGDSGCVIPGVPNDFGWATYASDKIGELLRDPELLERKSKMAVARATKHTWGDAYKVWEELILTQQG